MRNYATVRKGPHGATCVYVNGEHMVCYGEWKNAMEHVRLVNKTPWVVDKTAWWRKDRS